MDVKIDGTAVVPIGWVLTGFSFMVSVVVMGTFWIAAVNFRLQRIEQKLGLTPTAAHIDLGSPEAFAGEVEHAHPKRLFDPFQVQCFND